MSVGEPRARGRSTSAGGAVVRLLFVVAALALAWQAWRGFEAHQREQQRLLELMLTAPRTEALSEARRRDLLREADSVRAGLVAARSLLVAEMNGSWLRDVRPEELEERRIASITRLGEIRSLAAGALAERPSSWRAALFLGAATYLQILMQSPFDAVSRMSEWEQPLLLARSMNPGRPEADRYLAFAYLDVWLSLSPEKKREVVPVLRTAFEDSRTFSQLIELWFRLVHDRDLALSVVPDFAQQWRHLRGIFLRQRNWREFADAHESWRRASLSETSESLDRLVAKFEGGDGNGARFDLGRVVEHLAVREDHLSVLQRALELARRRSPALLPNRGAKAWLDLVVDLCLTSGCPLERELLASLTAAAVEMEPGDRALAELVSGHLGKADEVARGSGSVVGSEWGSYYILKAERELERGRVDEAADSLLRVAASAQSSVAYWRAKLELARQQKSPRQQDLAARQLESLVRDSWGAADWVRKAPSVSNLLVFPASAAELLSVTVEEAPQYGAVIEIFLDSEYLGVFVVGDGTSLAIPVQISATPHRLVVRDLTSNGRTRPGSTTLGAG